MDNGPPAGEKYVRLVRGDKLVLLSSQRFCMSIVTRAACEVPEIYVSERNL
jgi:hypothetical protein